MTMAIIIITIIIKTTKTKTSIATLFYARQDPPLSARPLSKNKYFVSKTVGIRKKLESFVIHKIQNSNAVLINNKYSNKAMVR